MQCNILHYNYYYELALIGKISSIIWTSLMTSVYYSYYMFDFSGSSTACILSFNCNTGLLHAANLGDSGFLAIRNGTIIGESMNTVHYFNCPFQLSNAPPIYDHISHVISDRYNTCWFSASPVFRPRPSLAS